RLLEKPKAILARKLHALDTEEELSASNCVDLLENQRQIKDYFGLKRKHMKKKRKKIIYKTTFSKNPKNVEISQEALGLILEIEEISDKEKDYVTSKYDEAI
ncbi:MAG: hypothetical protein U9Q63_02715, partial [Patescibacteria group bacterium]|nr:hypothetical protein [Patescibacteria group bacterium]